METAFVKAEREAVFAYALLRVGDATGAREHFGRAARIYQEFVESLPPEKRRTRAHYAVDAVQYLLLAGDLGAAESLACRILSEEGVEEFPRAALGDLLLRVRYEQRGGPVRGTDRYGQEEEAGGEPNTD